MTDQSPYNEQIPMVNDAYQAEPQETWSDDPYQQPYQQVYQQPMNAPYPPPQGWPAYSPVPAVYDSGSAWWAVLGALFPLVGFILFLSWQWRKPKCAEMAGLGALIIALAGLAFAIMSILLIVMGFASIPYNL